MPRCAKKASSSIKSGCDNRKNVLLGQTVSLAILFNSDKMQDLYFFSVAVSAIIVLFIGFIVIVFNR